MSRETNLVGLPSVDRPWLKYYEAGRADMQMPSCTLYELFEKNNLGHSDEIAIFYLTRTIRYGEMSRQIDRCTRSLLALGVQRDDIVTIAMPSQPEAYYLVYALNRIGAIANMIHPLGGADEICRYINEVQSRLCFLTPVTYETLRGHLHRTAVEKAVVVTPAASLQLPLRWLYAIKNRKQRLRKSVLIDSWRGFLKSGKGNALPASRRATDDWAVISHTGGTTGTPKGVVCSNLNIIAQAIQIMEGRGCRRQDCMMIQLPPFINYSLVTSLESFCFGFKTLLIPKYEPLKLVHYIKKYKVNYTHSIPAYWEALLHIPNIGPDDLSSLRAIASGGEAMDTKTEAEVNRLLHAGGAAIDLMKGLGMTESTSGVVGSYPPCNPEGCVGIPFVKTNCKIVDVSTDNELTYGEEGELCFSGPTIMVGYYNDAAATDEIIKTDSNGTRWLHTGDVGYMTEDGILYITGRLKRLLMQKDENGMVSKIFPERIEGVIMQMPEIEECCVVGKSDSMRITLPVAYVTVANSQPLSMERENIGQEVVRWCHDRLPAYMVPAEVHVLATMPRTDRGKIDYRALEKGCHH